MNMKAQAAADDPGVEAATTDEPGDPAIGLQITTTMTKDYLNRPLVNPTPGTSNATDYLGRAVTAGNKDYMARNLVA
jgi:hypothetical protein